MSNVNPPDEARTKALLSAMIGCFDGYSPVEAACATATLAILITNGTLGPDATLAMAHMINAENKSGAAPCTH